ncbi:DUF1990 domain-containing protein [Rhodococcus triatomae]|uniref:Uncharacterized protein, UPF0548 family n=1 Tax=Rhodococcus triatomae TaxID=300028 RepID=A0A1G8G8J7_9NOCA|nr:DUF1990 domain-containing protein [Rhodococcus triatomae]QNG20459.1 DUF1990 domain-containing protein [Rhodococcus triatomae]QNG23624.1 DUF1990 domain-containing protein [Rhodococcus triatomae]SDH90601.1 Uncharacterized protein, UPF0548 family [Rhodococcus triatomae]
MSRTPLSQRRLTYAEVGATAGALPPGYDHLERRCTLGTGEHVFRRAVADLMHWDMHRRAGIEVAPETPDAATGVRVSLRWGGRLLHLDAPCEVIYVVDDDRRRGFAYGTLDGHPERGEERFCVEWGADDAVVLSVIAFSRPALWWNRVTAPVGRRIQRHVTARYLEALTESRDV